MAGQGLPSSWPGSRLDTKGPCVPSVVATGRNPQCEYWNIYPDAKCQLCLLSHGMEEPMVSLLFHRAGRDPGPLSWVQRYHRSGPRKQLLKDS